MTMATAGLEVGLDLLITQYTYQKATTLFHRKIAPLSALLSLILPFVPFISPLGTSVKILFDPRAVKVDELKTEMTDMGFQTSGSDSRRYVLYIIIFNLV